MRQLLSKIPDVRVPFLGQNLAPVPLVKDLGIILDSNLTFNEHVACVAGVRKGRGRELGRETTREGGGRRGTPARKPLFSPSRLLIKK